MQETQPLVSDELAELSSYELQVHKSLRQLHNLAHVIRLVRELINGFDSVDTLARKLMIVAFGFKSDFIISHGNVFLPIAIAGGIAYALTGYAEESVRNEKMAELDELLNTLLNVIEGHIQQLEKNQKTKLPKDLHFVGFDFDLEEFLNDPQFALKRFINLLRKFNERLLYFYLHEYFSDYSLKKRNSRLHSQNKLIETIEKITGFKRNDPSCSEKLKVILETHSASEKNKKLDHAVVVSTLQLAVPKELKSNVKRGLSSLRYLSKEPAVKALVEISDIGMEFFSKFITGTGVVYTSYVFYGVIVAAIVGTVVAPQITIPLLIGMGVVGLTYAGVTAAYNTYFERKHNKIVNREKELVSLLKGQELVRKRTLKMRKSSEVTGNEIISEAHEQDSPSDRYLSAKRRIRVHQGIQTLYASFIGFVVGAAAMSMTVTIGVSIYFMIYGTGGLAITTALVASTVASFGLALIIPVVAMGVVFAVRQGIKTYRASVENSKEELRLIKANEDRLAELNVQYSGKTLADLHEKRKLDTKTLVRTMIDKFLKHAFEKSNGKISKQEKVLQLIEQAIGVKRDNTVAVDDQFYNAIAKFLKSPKNENKSKELVQALKNKIHYFDANNKDPNPVETVVKKEPFNFSSALKSVGIWIRQHKFAIMTAVVIGLLIPAILLGSGGVIGLGALGIATTAIVGTVVASFAVSRFLEWRQKKHINALKEEALNMDLAERIVKLNKMKVSLEAPVLEKHEEVKEQVKGEVLMRGPDEEDRSSLNKRISIDALFLEGLTRGKDGKLKSKFSKDLKDSHNESNMARRLIESRRRSFSFTHGDKSQTTPQNLKDLNPQNQNKEVSANLGT